MIQIENIEKCSKTEETKIDYERAYQELVIDNIKLRKQIKRYEELVQKLATINYVTGKGDI